MDAATAVRQRYRLFAAREAPGRSAVYAAWAAGVAADPDAAAILARIPAAHRQPALVFAVTRLLGAPVGEDGYGPWRAWLDENADAVVDECRRRTLQTNEPLRCAALLPVLALMPGPIALLELGASAGLCLYPDRYSYRYAGGCELDPDDGPSPVVLDCELRGPGVPPLALPEIVWRAGVDLHPRDAHDPADRAWIEGLVWPGEQARLARVRAALDIAAADPPILVAGDAADALPDLAARAPADATLVVTTPGVLVYVPREARPRVVAAARDTGRWITLDASDTHDAWHPPLDTRAARDGFAVALDGAVVGFADPLGRWLEWRHDPADAAV